MWEKYRDTIKMCFLPSQKSDDINNSVDISWRNLVEMFSVHQVRSIKDGDAFIPVELKDKSEWVYNAKVDSNGKEFKTYRLDANVKSISVLTLDLDEEGALEDAENAFSDYDYIIYSTHSYSESSPYKCRILVRLDEPVNASEWHGFLKNISDCIDIDLNCKNLSRVYLNPSVSPDSKLKPILKINNGKAFSLNDSLLISSMYKKQRSEEKQKAYDRSFNSSSLLSSVNDSSVQVKKTTFKTSRNGFGQKLSFDLDSMIYDFGSMVSNLQALDSRHAFARDVLFKSVSNCGLNIDWHNLIQFLYKTTLTVGSKPFHHGNTPSEIPDLIRHCFQKGYKGSISSSELESIFEQVKVSMKIAEQSMSSGIWNFNVSKLKNDIETGSLISNSLFDHDQILSRNTKALFLLKKEGDILGFIYSVYQNELDKFKDKVKINSVGQFIFKEVSEHLQGMNENITSYKEEIFSKVVFNEFDLNSFDDKTKSKMERYFNTSIKLGYLSSIGKRKFNNKFSNSEVSI